MSEEITEALKNLSLEDRMKITILLGKGISLDEIVNRALTNFFCALGI